MTWIPTPLMSGDEIYRNFQDGPGPGKLANSAAIVNSLVERYQGRMDQILRLRARMAAAWQGSAADAADHGLGPLVTEHELAGRALHVAQDLTARQVGSFGEARTAVVPVPPAPGDVDPLAVLANADVAASYFEKVALHNQAAQHNVDVMNGYTSASQYNAEGQPASYGQLADDLSGIGIDTRPGTENNGEPAESDVDGQRVGDVPAAEPGAASDAPPAGQEIEPAPGEALPPGTDPAAEAPRPAVTVPTNTTPAPTTAPPGTAPSSTVLAGGFGVPFTEAPGAERSHGGVPGNAPRHGGVLGDRAGGDGLPGARGSVPTTQPNTAARPVVLGVGPGRGGVGFAGLPAPTVGRREEDTERTAPAYLEGGDPEELWDTDELTAPPAIGDEDG